jgi:putative Holliday junction resolvase
VAPHPEKDVRSLVALDFGLRRIGVATGSCITGAAAPLDTIRAKAGVPDWAVLDRIMREWQPDVIVLGLPYNSDGTESEMTEIVRDFAALLLPRFKIPIEFVDERFTSAEAEALLKEDRRTGVRNKKLRKEDIDAKAAQLIAESWMRSTGESSPS